MFGDDSVRVFSGTWPGPCMCVGVTLPRELLSLLQAYLVKSYMFHEIQRCALQVLERGGPGPIWPRKWGPWVNFKGGGALNIMNLFYFVS